MPLHRVSWRIDSGVQLPDEGKLQIAVDIVAKEAPRPIALVCLPGGGMSRKYFDLRAPKDDSFSFALEMAERGFICVLIDHLGVGDSSKPADSYALDSDLLAKANAEATRFVLEEINHGRVFPEIPEIPEIKSIGVGHSMGAMLTVVQQARYAQHAAIVLMGFSTRGLPEYMSPEVREQAKDPVAIRPELPRLARALFGKNYPVIGRTEEGSSLYAGQHAEPEGVEAVKAARQPLLPVPAFQSMLPGNVVHEAAQIKVPVLAMVGDSDMVGPPERIGDPFTGSLDVGTKVLHRCGHSHFLFPARHNLFDGLERWAVELSQHF